MTKNYRQNYSVFKMSEMQEAINSFADMNEKVLKLMNNMTSFKKKLNDVKHNYGEF